MMDRANPYEVAEAIGRLNVWKAAAANNWALLPSDGSQWFVNVQEADMRGVKARMMFFAGWRPFHCFLITRQNHDFWVALSPADIPHVEVLFPESGPVQIVRYDEGYVQEPLGEDQRGIFARMLYACFGFVMRVEGDPQLPMKFVSERALFALKEDPDGRWSDCALPLPEKPPQFVEQVSLRKELLARAADLPFDASFALEMDFGRVFHAQTQEPRPRALYLCAAVDAKSGSRFLWRKMVVSGKPDGLLALWQSLAQTLLEHIVAAGRVPGEIRVRSMRMVRFLRPLGMHLPFKLVVNSKLALLDAEILSSIREGRL